MQPPVVAFDDDLFHRAHAMSATGRVVLGICGAPGAGKSTLAEQLVAAVRRRGAWWCRWTASTCTTTSSPGSG